MRRRPLGSITWGNRQQNFLGFVTVTDTGSGGVPLDPGSFGTGTPANGGPAFSPITSGPTFQSPIFSQPPIVIGPTASAPVITPASGAPGTAPVTTPTSATPIEASGLPAIVPVLVNPSSGTIPDPSTVAAGTTDTTSWFEQQMITGIPNWWLVAGAGLLYFMHNSGGKRR
jgi:hypothetical protein